MAGAFRKKQKGKLVGCKICGKQARQADMKVVKKSTNSYYHEGECWDKYLENKAFKEKRKGRDGLSVGCVRKGTWIPCSFKICY